MSQVETANYLRAIPIPRWTAVIERLPDEGTKCIVYAPKVGFDVPEVMAIMTWTKFKGWWPGVGDRVTHWMPAPETPKD